MNQNIGYKWLEKFKLDTAPWCLNCHTLSCGRNCRCCQPRCKRCPRCICGCLPQPAQCDRFPSVVAQFEPPPICRGCCDCCCRPSCNRDCPRPPQCPCCCCGCRDWLYCRPIICSSRWDCC
ncbi:unnamed protein product [Allacma fusca]|uniref:Uncharacterized protein n=1 Tax=Allacma fusca TaxID=39272 RepID=A0A8J2PFY0_9HEXA|nr:unnamed protein product [Allacma fusca]